MIASFDRAGSQAKETVSKLGFQERFVAAALRAARNYDLAAAPELFTERPLQVLRQSLQPTGQTRGCCLWHLNWGLKTSCFGVRCKTSFMNNPG